MRPHDWSYVSGLVAAQSGRVMDRRALLEMLDATDGEDVRTRLRAGLLLGATETRSGAKAVEVVSAAFADYARGIAAMSPSERIADIFLLEREWADFRKDAKRRMKPAETPNDPRGPNASAFADCWSGNIESARREPFRDAAVQIARDAPRKGDVAGWIDRLVDTHEARSVVRAAEELKSVTLSGWVRTWMALRAALSLVRVRLAEGDAVAALERWRAAGFDPPALDDIARGDRAAWAVALDRLGLPHAEEALRSDEPAVALARRIDERMSEFAAESAGMPFGPECVFAFLWMLRCEAINLRLALLANEYGIARERVNVELRVNHG